MLPFGELLKQASANTAVRVVSADSRTYDREHWWVAKNHSPKYRGEFLGVKFTETQRSVVSGKFEDALRWLSKSDIDNGNVIDKRTVRVERTPIPYKTAPTVERTCPECGAFGQTHEWKFQQNHDEMVNDCACCDYGGELDVERFH